MRRRWWRALLVLLGLTGLVVALGFYLSYSTPAPDTAPHPFNQDRNAVWLEHRWLERPQPVAETDALLQALSQHGVRYVFPHLIPFGSDGRLPTHNREQMRVFLQAAQRVAPQVKVLPWVGGLRAGYRRQRQGTIDLADLAQRQRVVAECRGLIDEGFDGIHLNVEPVDDGNLEYLALLRALRAAVGPDRLLSVSATRPGPTSLPFAPNFLWSLGYYERVAGLADQIVVMAYDTGLPTPALYRRYVSFASAATTRALVASPGHARVLLGVPTYDDTGLMHRRGVETPENALLGVVAGLRGLGGGGTFEGVALYAEWTTDADEWQVYESVWRGRAPAARAEVSTSPADEPSSR